MSKATKKGENKMGNNEVKFSFSFVDSDVRGVEEGAIDYTGRRIGGFDHTGWSAPLIRVNGQVFIAEQILKAMATGEYFGKIRCVKFGPGGRRKYRLVCDELFERLIGRIGANRKNAREEQIANERYAFVEALMDI